MSLRQLIDYIVTEKSKGNTFQELNYTMKLMLKGIPVKQITDDTPLDQDLLQKIVEAATEFNVQLPTKFA
jgi:copper homeostasis protein CutC